MNWEDIWPAAIAVATAIGSGATWLIRSRWEAANIEKQRLHETRRGVYLQYLDPFILVFAGIKDPAIMKKAHNDIASVDHRRRMFELALMGSDEVVRAANALQQHFYRDSPGPPDEFVQKICQLLLAIRRDLGNAKTKIEPIEMLENQITDIEKYL